MTDPAAEITKLRADLETAENTALRLAEKADAMRAVIVEVNRRLRYIAYEASQMWDASDEARSALAKLKPFLP